MKTKVCRGRRGCGKRKPLTEFHRQTARPDGHHTWCKDCCNALNRTSYNTPKRKEYHRASQRAYSQTPKGKEYFRRYKQDPKHKAARRAYNQTPESKERRRIYSQTPKGQEIIQAYHQTPKYREIIRNATRRRQMRKLKARPPWVDEAATNSIYAERDAAIVATGIAQAVDHFYPLRHRDFSGLDVPWNLRVITAAENGAKCNQRPDEFYSKREFKRIVRELDARRTLSQP